MQNFFENVVLISLFSLRLIKATKYYGIGFVLRENKGKHEKISPNFPSVFVMIRKQQNATFPCELYLSMICST